MRFLIVLILWIANFATANEIWNCKGRTIDNTSHYLSIYQEDTQLFITVYDLDDKHVRNIVYAGEIFSRKAADPSKQERFSVQSKYLYRLNILNKQVDPETLVVSSPAIFTVQNLQTQKSFTRTLTCTRSSF